MLKKWKTLSRAERLQYQAVFIFMLIGIYTFSFYRVSTGKLSRAEQMLSRRQNRIETRASLSNLGANALTPKTVQKKIDKVEEQIDEAVMGFDELDTGFAPVDSSEMRQQLMLEISTLAERTGVVLNAVATKGMSVEGAVEKVPLDPVLGRPLLLIDANARFWSLIDFMHGLKDLSFYVSVMNIQLSAEPIGRGGQKNRELPEGVLYVSLEVSM